MKLFDIIKNINEGQEPVTFENEAYTPFVVNKALSLYPDTILYANLMNEMHTLDRDMQYTFLFNVVRKRHRYTPWPKKINQEAVPLIMSYYKYSRSKAESVLHLFDDVQLNKLQQEMDKGGIS